MSRHVVANCSCSIVVAGQHESTHVPITAKVTGPSGDDAPSDTNRPVLESSFTPASSDDSPRVSVAPEAAVSAPAKDAASVVGTAAATAQAATARAQASGRALIPGGQFRKDF